MAEMLKTLENLRIPKTFFRWHVDVHMGAGDQAHVDT